MSGTVNLLTAVMGAGKTLFCVKLIDDLLTVQYDKDGQALPLPQIYTNVEGLKLDKFQAPQNIHLFNMPDETEDRKVFDWRDCPQGSVVIYDEAQYFFPRHMTEEGGKRNETPKILLDMTMARHMGIELWLVTQDALQIHTQIRNVVGMHKHLYRAANAQLSTIYTWHHYSDSPNSRQEQSRAMAELWSFPKRYFDYYKSAQIHTRKWKMPSKLKWLLFFIMLTFGWSVYALIRDGGFNLAKVEPQAQPQPQPAPTSTQPADASVAAVTRAAPSAGSAPLREPATHQPAPAAPTKPSAFAWSSVEEAAPVAGCVYSTKRGLCQCFSERGVTLDLEPAACFSAANKPLPVNINISGGGGGSQVKDSAANKPAEPATPAQ